jgi:hypothetical protein
VETAKIYAWVSQTMRNSLANSSDQAAGQLVGNKSGLGKVLKDKNYDNGIFRPALDLMCECFKRDL